MTEAAFFDLDKTLLPGAALFPLAREMYRQRIFTARDILRLAGDQLAYRLSGSEGQSRMGRARDASLEAIRGRSQHDIVELGRSVAREELLPRLYPQVVELLSRHKRAGREVFICSSSPEDYLALLAEELEVDGVVGTRAEVIGGHYTGELDGAMCHGDEKARRVAELAKTRDIDLARSYAYSDSVNDLPFLELAGNPVATNPDRALLVEARKRGWQVLDFRTARRRTMIASVAGVGAAAAGATGYVVGYVVGRNRTLGQRPRWKRRVTAGA
jgi:HAD superfamily hydrolase (TIGR01490 family)